MPKSAWLIATHGSESLDPYVAQSASAHAPWHTVLPARGSMRPFDNCAYECHVTCKGRVTRAALAWAMNMSTDTHHHRMGSE